MSKTSGHFNKEMINGSINTLSSVESLINSVDIADNFYELEEYFKQINFEHDNCVNYKEYLDSIYDNLNSIKKKINELTSALRKTKMEFTNLDEPSSSDIKSLSEVYGNTPASESLRKILSNAKTDIKSSLQTAVETATEELINNSGNVTVIPTPSIEETQIASKPYSTVPIGLAIGATGIAGSIGAVVVNDKYGSITGDEILEEYQESYDSDDGEDFGIETPQADKSDYIAPYHAQRMEREADRFYGNQKEILNLEDDEIELDEYNSDDDDTDNDDFSE